MILQNLEELGLEFEIHITDLVEENGASVGHFEHAGFLLECAGKSPSLVPEQLAFDSSEGRAAQFSFRNGFRAREDRACNSLAITSFPHPVSPSISTGASDGPISWNIPQICRMRGFPPKKTFPEARG